MKLFLFILTVGAIVFGAFLFLTRESCEDCGAAQKAYCQEVLNQHITQEGELRLTYVDRIRMVMKGCF